MWRRAHPARRRRTGAARPRPWLDGRVRNRGLRMSGFGADVEIEWPGPSFPATGSAVPRTELDERIRRVAVDDGAQMLLGVKAVEVSHDSLDAQRR